MGDRENRPPCQPGSATFQAGAPGGQRIEAQLERQLQCEQVVAEISRRMLGVSAGELDETLRDCLGMMGRLARADRVNLLLIGPGRSFDRAIHWKADDRPWEPPPWDPEVSSRFTWSAAHLIRGEPFVVERLADLPEGARAERVDLERRGVRSLLGVSVRSREEIVGYLSFESLAEERSWAETEVRLLRIAGELLAGAATRAAAEAALRESGLRFQALVENTPDMITEHDAEGRVLYASPSVIEALGEQVQREGFDPTTLVVDEDRDKVMGAVLEALREDRPASTIVRYRSADGAARWGEVSARVFRSSRGDVRAVVSTRDITDREQQLLAEQALLAISRRLLDIPAGEIEASLDEVLGMAAGLAGADRAYLTRLHATEDTRRTEWVAPGVESRGAEVTADESHRFAWSAREIARGTLHIPDVELLPPEAEFEKEQYAARGVRACLGLAVAVRGKLIGYLAFDRVSRAGGWREQEISQLQLVAEMIGSALRRQRAEGELERSRAALAESQKMEAVGRLAGGIAHDFNNLLMVIGGHAELLTRGLAEGDPLQEDVRQVSEAVDRAASLARRLLAFGRPQPTDRRRVDLNEVVLGLEEMLQRLLGEDVELSFDLAPGATVVLADPHELEQVVVNLVLNGRDAMPNGGRLVVATLATAEGEVRRMGVSVRDQGTGMDEATRRRAFEPFYTTKEPGKGTGLGLSIVYGIVQRIGGEILTSSTPGLGTEVRILLPPARGDAEAEPPAARGPEQGRGETVLLVEDEAAVRRVVRWFLHRAGYVVIEAENGEAALHLASLPDPIEDPIEDRIDVVVTDVVMPRLGGAELARRLWASRPELGFVFLSGYARGSGDAATLAGGEFLQKPFSGEELLGAVRRAIESKDDPAEV